jgi:hypothetical protein
VTNATYPIPFPTENREKGLGPGSEACGAKAIERWWQGSPLWWNGVPP